VQETEAAVDATVRQVMAAVEPLEAAWQAELQRLQVRLTLDSIFLLDVCSIWC
jgi:hypothetical protein